MNFFKHHIGDYDSATAHLSWLEDMAYTRLIRLYYRTEKPLPLDIKLVCRLVRANTRHETRAVEICLGEFFDKTELGYTQKRCEEEITAAHEKAKRNREAGLRGGRPPKKETQTVSKNNPDANPDGLQTKPTDNPIQTPRLQTPRLQDSKTTPLRSVVSKSKSCSDPQKVAAKVSPLGPRIWGAYNAAYIARYSVEPVRNERVNSQLADLGKRLGEEAPDVAAWYVASNASFYVQAKHSVGLLLRDAEGLRTEWATGRHVTQTQARQADRKQSNFSIAQTLLAEGRGDGH